MDDLSLVIYELEALVRRSVPMALFIFYEPDISRP